jgi:hypothetical protein
MDDTRARFISAIADRLGEDQIVEVHLFSPIRQGVLETGVAVVAVTPSGEGDGTGRGAGEGNEEPLPADSANDEATADTVVDPSASSDGRLVVYTARYRLTRKGPDRGKWLFEIAATADAPLATVDAVARGVTLRAKDVTETERLSGEQMRTLLRSPAWRTPK